MTTTIQRIWRPFLDEPLFVPEFVLGAGALPEYIVQEVRGYLTRLVEVRYLPVHTAVAWNALHFGYDTDRRRYRTEVLRPGAFPVLTGGESTDTPPVGALVRLPTGETHLWAEVVHRELDDPSIDRDGFVPSRLSGAPSSTLAGDSGGVRLRLVVDPDVSGLLEPRQRNALRRLRQRGRLDGFGHLLLTAPVDDDLDGDDLAGYARYLVIRRDELLAGGPLQRYLESPDDELFEVVLGSLHTVRDLLTGTTGIDRWRHYVTCHTRHDQGAPTDDPVNDGTVEDVVRRVRAARPTQVRHTAVGTALRGLMAGIPDAEMYSGLGGTRYLTWLVRTHLRLASEAESQGDHGRLPDGVHLRLDDDRLGGGVWRAEGSDIPSGVHAGVSPLVPIGIGYMTAVGGEQSGAPDQTVDKSSVETDHLSFRITLHPVHLATGTLPLPEAIAIALEAADSGGSVTLRLRHAGEILAPEEEFQAPLTFADSSPPALTGVEWPLGFHPGIRLTCHVDGTDERRITASTVLLAEPTDLLENLLTHDTDLTVLRAFLALGERQPDGRRGDLAVLAALLLRVLRRAGRPGPGGSRYATAPALAATAYAGLPTPPDAGTRAGYALGYLVTRGRLEVVPGDSRTDVTGRVLERDPDVYVWWPPDVSRVPFRTSTGSFPHRSTPVGRRRVPIFLRQLPPGWRASPEKLAAWPDVRAALGPDCLLPGRLPDGFTWVEAHERGRDVLSRAAVPVRPGRI